MERVRQGFPGQPVYVMSDVDKYYEKLGFGRVGSIFAFKNTGRYIKHQKDLLQVIDSEEQGILNDFIALKNGAMVEFDSMSERLFNWVKNLIKI